jgi:ElaB/YqjD/DUF883 family membrane-anchored ribosome-binding protein
MNANEHLETALGAPGLEHGEESQRRLRALRPVRPNAHEAREVADLEGPAARVSALARATARRIRARPLASFAIAVGIGFVVGGALSFRAGRIALAAAARHVARELLKQVL